MHVSLSPGRPLFVTLCQWETPCDACGSFPCIPSCDNDLRPAPASPLEAKRSTANSYFTCQWTLTIANTFLRQLFRRHPSNALGQLRCRPCPPHQFRKWTSTSNLQPVQYKTFNGIYATLSRIANFSPSPKSFPSLFYTNSWSFCDVKKVRHILKELKSLNKNCLNPLSMHFYKPFV